MTRRIGWLVVLIVMFVPVASWACPVCFGEAGQPLTEGAGRGILFMLGIIAFVQIGFIALFWTFWRRARELRRRQEQFHWVDEGAR